MAIFRSRAVFVSLCQRHCYSGPTRPAFYRSVNKPSMLLSPFSSEAYVQKTDDCFDASDNKTLQKLVSSFFVYEDFITESEEMSLFKESENYLRRLRYESAHWDNAIHGYREVERQKWNQESMSVLERVKKVAFNDNLSTMSLIHVLDLHKTGHIKPHIDSIKFCGSVIAGLSLLSPSVMRLALEKDPKQYADCLLQPRSLYVMTGTSRYDFTHEVLKEEESVFKGQTIPRDRRISIMCRCEPKHELPNS